jgi:hypothetical protein
VDTGILGSKDRRPALDQLMRDARARRIDVVVCWRAAHWAIATEINPTTLDMRTVEHPGSVDSAIDVLLSKIPRTMTGPIQNERDH